MYWFISILTILCGFHQGSILGPLLFLIYINDIVNISELIKFIIFADDTNLFFKHKNLNTLVSIINTELIQISSWFKLNKLSLNISKTNFIHIQSSNAYKNVIIHIFIDNIKITRITNTKFLEVIINSWLTWNDHITTISSKLCLNIGILAKIHHNIPSTILIQLYYTLVQPYLVYCNLIWAAGSNISLTALFIKQKKAWPCYIKTDNH